MRVVFSHGKESGPWGSKIRRLADIAQRKGYSVESIDYTDTTDPDERIKRLLKHLENSNDKPLLVGSSMGGYVSLVSAMRQQVKGVFLLAPALYMPGYAEQDYSASAPTTIVHGWSDDVIPYQHSVRFAERVSCSLHLIKGDHRLNASLDEVAQLFELFLANLELS